MFFKIFKNLKKEKEIEELSEIKKMLVKKDLELLEIRRKREKENQILKEKLIQLEKSRIALLSILEDVRENEKKIKIQQKILNDTVQYFFHGIILFGKNQKILLTNQKVFEFFKIKTIGIKEKDYRKLEMSENYIKIFNLFTHQKVVEREINFNNFYFKINKIIFKKNETIDYLLILNNITKEKENEQAQADFIALTAHQLRTPLSGIRWTLEMFLDASFGKLQKEQREYIQKLSNNTERLIKVVNRFLDVAQIQEGRAIGKKEKKNLINLIDKIIEFSRPSFEKKNIEVDFNFSENIIEDIYIDEEKIKIVIQNLLENAIRYSKDNSKIEIRLKNDEEKLFFSIKDNGYGIPLDEQKKIFSKFFRSSNIKKIDTEGSGLGLFVIKNIIETHGGNIWFQSEGENKGTTFFFALPKHEF